jgi:membrane protein YqaA with SNARE-associated domain
MTDLIIYLGLFISAFSSATILPGNSEIIFVGLLAKGYNLYWLLLFAALGNTLGSLTGYLLGMAGNWLLLEKYLKIQKHKIEKWLSIVNKYQIIFAFLSWIPFIGDFFPVALGVAKANVMKITLFIAIGKFLRYVALALIPKLF